MAAAQKSTILYAENDKKVLDSQGDVLQKAGHAVTRTIGRAATEQALKQQKFDLLILGHTLTKDDRHHLPYKARKSNEEMSILVLHASGNHHEVDMAMDSREGPEAVLRAVAGLLARPVAAAAGAGR